ncbi:MAG: PB1 domain-containing protein [Promethearchaeota archaeon]
MSTKQAISTKSKFPITTIKTTLGADVRRFSAWCNDKGEPEYAKTMVAICRAYGISSDAKEVAIQYKDIDGDIVSIKSTKELRHAFTECTPKGSCLRLNIVVNDMEPPSGGEDEEASDDSDSEYLGDEEKEVLFKWNVGNQDSDDKEEISSKWMVPKFLLLMLVEHAPTGISTCHPFCNQMHVSAMTGEYIERKKPICFFLLYQMCLHHKVIPSQGEPMSHEDIYKRWKQVAEIYYYIAICGTSIMDKYNYGTILDCILELARRLDHFTSNSPILSTGHRRLYCLTKGGQQYIRTLV